MSPRARLVVSLVLVACVAAFEVWGGLRAGSLALLTDAAHVCMDAFALGVALFAMNVAQRPPNARKTFGYARIEVLAALFNGSVLLAVTGFLVFEAARRFFTPEHTQGALMSEVAAAGLCVNVAITFMLRESGKHNLNMQAALFHVAGDALGAFAVIVGGVAIALTRATWIDPALSMFVAGIIVIGVLRVVRDAADVLLEAVPPGMRVRDVSDAIVGLGGAVALHDLHVWTIGTGELALSAHVQVEDRRVSEATAIARSIEELVRERFGITHVTLQFECERCSEDERVVCTQKRAES